MGKNLTYTELKKTIKEVKAIEKAERRGNKAHIKAMEQEAKALKIEETEKARRINEQEKERAESAKSRGKGYKGKRKA